MTQWGAASPIDRERQAAQQAFMRGDLRAAEAACTRVLQTSKNDPICLHLTGRIAAKRGQLDQADAIYKQCLRLRPRDASVRFSIAEVLLHRGQADEALKALDDVLRLRPDQDLARIEQASINDRRGNYDAAHRALGAIRSTAPQIRSRADHIRVTVAMHEGKLDEAVQIAEAAVADESLEPLVRSQIAFLGGQALDKMQESDRAFAMWVLANDLIKRPFSREAYEQVNQRVMAFFTRDRMRSLSRAGNESEAPVFVAGMPRSGTTLVEQIIDAHPRGHGAGEITHVEAMPVQISNATDGEEIYPECLARADATLLDTLADEYLHQLSVIGGGAARVVNKNLVNYKLAGLVQILFPKARIIFCRRDPIDTCLSIYMNMFAPNRFPWKYSMEDLAFAYGWFAKITEHWKQSIDLPWMEVCYEDLVANQEARTREIIDFCGLDWNDSCLKYHDSGRTVMTLSYHQVSQPIYTSAVNRYTRYEKHLEPLIRALRDNGSIQGEH